MNNRPQSVAILVVFRAFLASDHLTPATGKTIAITISKNGGAFGNPNAGALNATEISSGWYKAALDTTDSGTAGPLAVRGAEGTIDDVGVEYYVQAPPSVNVTQLLGTAWLTPGTAGTPDVNVKLWNALAAVALPLIPTIAGRTLDVDASGRALSNLDTIKSSPVVNGGTVTFPTNATLASTTNITAAAGCAVSSLGANVVTATAIAADAITAAKIADGAIDRATFAADTGHASIRSNTAQAGGASTITLDASASATTDFYNEAIVLVTGGTGVGQTRLVTAYDGTTKVATVSPAWATQPDNTSTFALLPNSRVSAVTGNVLGNVVGSVGSVSGLTAADVGAIKAKTDNLPATPASTTNITAGTITTVTNLTNAPTAGDLTATMKTSVTTAATAATPTAAAVTGAVGSVTGAVGSVTGNVGGNVTGSVGSLAAQAKSDVNAEVVDALSVDTYAEPGQEAPAATNTLAKKIGYLFKFLRNKVEQTSTTLKVYADDATTVDQKSAVSDDATTYTRGEIGSGP